MARLAGALGGRRQAGALSKFGTKRLDDAMLAQSPNPCEIRASRAIQCEIPVHCETAPF